MGQQITFNLPDLGEGLTEGEVVTWLLAPGDAVKLNQPFVEVETAKALVEVPSPHDGVLAEHHAKEGETIPEDPLSPRESEIVKLIAEGHTSREIADTLVISDKTVERHRANILEKLGMRDRVELTRYAIRRGLVQP
jgi:pyruvate/2-oxoglutarate dehydrogenase complex dihydrolipoamide acyltransferase (E2) component